MKMLSISRAFNTYVQIFQFIGNFFKAKEASRMGGGMKYVDFY